LRGQSPPAAYLNLSVYEFTEKALKASVAEVKSRPNDMVARERVIRLAHTMKSPPEIPEEAREHYVIAATLVEAAKNRSGFESAIEQYKAALMAAPWWADAYKKLAIAQKAADHYDDAIASLHLYLLTQPADARDAQDEIYKLKALKQATAEKQQRGQREEQRRASAQAAAARKTRNHLEDEWCQAAGNDYDTCVPYTTHPMITGRMRPIISRSGNGYSVKFIDLAGQGDITCTSIEANGSNIKFTYTWGSSVRYDLTLTDDGKQLHGTSKYYSNGQWVSACPSSTPCVHYVRVR
jgi:tetratricopeptide (TPR) repeat protein